MNTDPEQRSRIAGRLDALQLRVRTTAELVYQEGWSVAEVAALYGVTPDWIRQRLRQARQALGVSSAEEWRAAVEDLEAQTEGG
ncbi:sigma factor-like helix-turn-helix DNA-binding protein [Kitasatospora cathayae]|uniref:Sigma factor-like helix-turn-helix DNA-binding protein n=1 Tax=Kitasatospora cathayae TaxID=3004092 RepID=A0ABY7QA18_9ACTN|nr:sigma factor-like helix-turn-helix DNA-binding protein [Kitasatospora sp. HUAS 3-15]WBP89506.1 sigma factor-like helix-turn-helix DNA-binding protein [Kitasatospora sp. HUAS 3-15]